MEMKKEDCSRKSQGKSLGSAQEKFFWIGRMETFIDLKMGVGFQKGILACMINSSLKILGQCPKPRFQESIGSKTPAQNSDLTSNFPLKLSKDSQGI
jgi:hypothetical protein